MMVEPLYASYKDITAMHLELTTRCNAACPMCPRHINNGGGLNPNLELDEISLEQFKTWFPPDFIQQLRRVYACGNYGDPIAAKDTLEIYKYIREHNDKVALVIHTNGSARSTSWWKELASVMNGGDGGRRQDYVVFSVDGLEDTNHLYRRNTNFKKILENMRAYTSAGGKARWDYIVFQHNEHQVEEAKRLAHEMGFTFFNIKKTTRWHMYKDSLGYFDVYDGDQVTHTLRQPKNPIFQHENAIEFKRSVGLIPQFVTNDEFDRLYPDPRSKQEMHVYDPETDGYISIKHNTLGIDCRAKRGKYQSENEIFVSGTGHVFPCCFLGGEPWRANSDSWNPNDSSMRMIELSGGMDAISLKHRNLQQIIDTPFYQRYLPLSFKKNHAMRSHQCSACCGEEYNNLDQGELGSSQRVITKQKQRDESNAK